MGAGPYSPERTRPCGERSPIATTGCFRRTSRSSQPSVYLGGGENRDKLAQRQGGHRIAGEIGSAVGLSDALERPVSYALDEPFIIASVRGIEMVKRDP